MAAWMQLLIEYAVEGCHRTLVSDCIGASVLWFITLYTVGGWTDVGLWKGVRVKKCPSLLNLLSCYCFLNFYDIAPVYPAGCEECVGQLD